RDRINHWFYRNFNSELGWIKLPRIRYRRYTRLSYRGCLGLRCYICEKSKQRNQCILDGSYSKYDWWIIFTYKWRYVSELVRYRMEWSFSFRIDIWRHHRHASSLHYLLHISQ